MKKTVLIWAITQRVVVVVVVVLVVVLVVEVPYRRFGTTYRSHIQGSTVSVFKGQGFRDPGKWYRYVVPKRR